MLKKISLLLLFATLFIYSNAIAGIWETGKVVKVQSNNAVVKIFFGKCKGLRKIENNNLKVGKMVHLFFKSDCKDAVIKEAPK